MQRLRSHWTPGISGQGTKCKPCAPATQGVPATPPLLSAGRALTAANTLWGLLPTQNEDPHSCYWIRRQNKTLAMDIIPLQASDAFQDLYFPFIMQLNRSSNLYLSIVGEWIKAASVLLSNNLKLPRNSSNDPWNFEINS